MSKSYAPDALLVTLANDLKATRVQRDDLLGALERIDEHVLDPDSPDDCIFTDMRCIDEYRSAMARAGRPSRGPYREVGSE